MINVSHLQSQIAQYAPEDRASITATLKDIVRELPDDPQAWLCLSASVETNEQRLECLERARRLDMYNAEIAGAIQALHDEDIQSMRNLLANCRSIVPTILHEAPLLGSYLKERGVSGPLVEGALALQRHAATSERRPLLGEILIKQGWSTPHQVADMLIAQTRARLEAGETDRLRQIGEFLLVRGDITIDQLHYALLRQLEQLENGRSMLLGEVLVNEGFITSQCLAQALRQQEIDYQRRFY
jgi:hypothetical protein